MSRVGTKRSDKRWRAPDGSIWASEFEWRVYDAISRSGREVRRCDKRDSLAYTTKVRSGRCVDCGSGSIVQDRSYTPDLCVGGAAQDDEFYLEVKGYMRASRRAQLREVAKQHRAVDLRFILEKGDARCTSKYDLGEYIDHYYKRPWVQWNGELPDAWK